MPFDGSGNFNRVRNWVNDALAHIKIKSDLHDSEDDNFAAGLSNTLTKDGQSQPTANIPLNGKKLVNVAAPTNPTDAATKGYVDGVRSFSTGISLTGATPLATIGFTVADVGFGTRVAGTPAGTPNRFVWNDKPDLSGTDVMVLNETGGLLTPIRLDGVSTGTAPNYVSTALQGFTEADMAIVGRRDAATTPAVVKRIAINDKADGTGNDIFIVNEDGTITSRAADGTQKKFAPATALPLNRIVNGAFQHSQENGNTGGAANLYYGADQWLDSWVGLTGVSLARSGPDTLGEWRLGLSLSVAKPSLAAGDLAAIETRIEGWRIADFQWGLAAPKPVLLAFTAFSTTGGTYSVAIRNNPVTHTWLGTFTIPPNTFQPVVLPIPAPPGGTWAIDNSVGMYLDFTFAAGASFQAAAGWAATSGKLGATGMSNAAATAQTAIIKNVGLYLDPDNTGVPPPWQIPDPAEELLACQRYWTNQGVVCGTAMNGSGIQSQWVIAPKMRVIPSVALLTGGVGSAYSALYPDIFRATANASAFGQAQVGLNARM